MTMIFPATGGGLGTAIPYQGSVNAAQLTTFLDLEQADVVRMRRYAQHWQFYHSLQWEFEREEGAPLVTLNYARAVVDKAVSWMVKNGIDFDIPKALEGTVKPLLEEVWKYNDLNTFLYNMATVGAVTGDAFVLVTFAQPTDLARARNPNSQGQIRVDLLGSEQCFPTWDPLNTDVMTSIRIETVFYDHDTRMRAAETQEHPRQGQSNLTIRRFTQTITKEWIIEQFEGSPPVYKPNTLGAIPVVHVQNIPIAREFFGISELDNVMTLQQEINEKTTDQSDIIHYHAGPITVITGGKGAALEYGPNKIWSGFPADTKVSNLEMTTDLGAIQSYIEFTRKTFLELTETPEILFTTPEISNTSGVALHLMYQPIVDKTKRKVPGYQKGIRQINEFILRIAQTLGLIQLPFDLCEHCGGRIVEKLDPFTKQLTKKCYRINADYSWMDPEQVKVVNVRDHSMGYELREVPMHQIRDEQGQTAASYWDPQTQQTQQAQQDRRMQEQDRIHNAQMAAEPQKPTPEGTPNAPAPKSRLTPAVTAEPPRIQGDFSLPEEPESLILSTMVTDPATGAVMNVDRQLRSLVPTGCEQPKYLDPLWINVEFKDSLPRDHQLDLTFNLDLMREGIVSRKWVQRKTAQIDPEDYDLINREIQEEERERARPEGILPESAAAAQLQQLDKGAKKGAEQTELQRSALPGGHNSSSPSRSQAI